MPPKSNLNDVDIFLNIELSLITLKGRERKLEKAKVMNLTADLRRLSLKPYMSK